ncbi:DUF3108 domain-containing protein [Candidatus Desantisbacteria bacterium]|nr:DUF3108 domain-containing protein [Candidatus Desantisbacteria bacterium]
MKKGTKAQLNPHPVPLPSGEGERHKGTKLVGQASSLSAEFRKAQRHEGINLRALREFFSLSTFRSILIITILIGCRSYGFAEKLPFNEQETLSFSIEMFGMKIGAQTMQSCLLQGSQTIQLISETRTSPFASKIYKLNNKIETRISTKDFLPIYMKNQIQEGKYIKNWNADLDQRNHLGTITLIGSGGKKSEQKGQKGQEQVVTLSLQPNTINIPALIYYLRTTELRLNNSFSFALLKEDNVEEITVKVEKQEKIHVPYGDFATLKVVSSLGDVIIWFTLDKRRLPVKIECQTGAGWLKAELVGSRGNPLWLP